VALPEGVLDGMRLHHATNVATLAAEALASGGVRRSIISVDWDVSGRCEAPRIVPIHGRPCDEGLKWYEWTAGKEHSLTVEMAVPCRKCLPCRRAKTRLWRGRISPEMEIAERTWFGTLTFSNREWSKIEAEAGTTDLRPCLRVAGKRVTNFVKRVRKGSGALGLRLLIVTELTKRGRPHYHVLVHEPDMANVVRHRMLVGQWPHGFSKWNEVKAGEHRARVAAYLAKYLTKAPVGRVRAARGYGRPVENRRLKDGLVHNGFASPLLGQPRGAARLRGSLATAVAVGGALAESEKTHVKRVEGMSSTPPLVPSVEKTQHENQGGRNGQPAQGGISALGARLRHGATEWARLSERSRRRRDDLLPCDSGAASAAGSFGPSRRGSGGVERGPERETPARPCRVKPYIG
jgi:hypothetical protein